MLEFDLDVPKEAWKYLKTVVAFSNTRGGHIIFGVLDDRTVVGFPDVSCSPRRTRSQTRS